MQARKPAPLVAAATILSLMSFIPCRADGPAAVPPVSKKVVLTGWLQVTDYDFALTSVEAEVDGVVMYPAVSRNGRFQVELPTNTKATFRFEHPGHVPKEVVVDTHFANDGGFVEQTRHIRIGVVLEQERHMAGLTYAGPVGNVGFDKGGGCVVVEKTRKMVPVRRGKAVEF